MLSKGSTLTYRGETREIIGMVLEDTQVVLTVKGLSEPVAITYDDWTERVAINWQKNGVHVTYEPVDKGFAFSPALQNVANSWASRASSGTDSDIWIPDACELEAMQARARKAIAETPCRLIADLGNGEAIAATVEETGGQYAVTTLGGVTGYGRSITAALYHLKLQYRAFATGGIVKPATDCAHLSKAYEAGNTYCVSCREWLHAGPAKPTQYVVIGGLVSDESEAERQKASYVAANGGSGEREFVNPCAYPGHVLVISNPGTVGDEWRRRFVGEWDANPRRVSKDYVGMDGDAHIVIGRAAGVTDVQNIRVNPSPIPKLIPTGQRERNARMMPSANPSEVKGIWGSNVSADDDASTRL